MKRKDCMDPKLCGCHPPAGRHRFGKTLVCVRDDCPVDWHQFQLEQHDCEGGNVAVSRRKPGHSARARGRRRSSRGEISLKSGGRPGDKCSIGGETK